MAVLAKASVFPSSVLWQTEYSVLEILPIDLTLSQNSFQVSLLKYAVAI